MQKKFKRLAAAVLAALLIATSAPAALAAKNMQAKAAAALYAKPKSSAKKLLTVEKGDAVAVSAVNGNWARVTVGGHKGYMPKKYLTAASPSPAEAATKYAAKKAKMYKSAKTSSKVVKTVPQGAEVAVLSVKGSWAKAKYGGKTGYIAKKYLTDERPQAEATPAPEPQATPTPQPQPTPTPAPTKESEPDETLQYGDKGEAVKKLQKRLKELGWFFGDIGGNYLDLTKQAVKDFQDAAGLDKTGTADAKTLKKLYSSSAPKNKLGDSTSKPASGAVQEMDWWQSGIQQIFARGSTATVTDVKSGISWKVYRSGGTNHADVQPLTAADTAAMKRAYGGTFSWNRHAIWVSIGGKRYAASMNGMPHGNGSITTNNFDGHHCIHFTNSRTHGTNRVDEAHQAAIKQALKAG